MIKRNHLSIAFDQGRSIRKNFTNLDNCHNVIIIEHKRIDNNKTKKKNAEQITKATKSFEIIVILLNGTIKSMNTD